MKHVHFLANVPKDVANAGDFSPRSHHAASVVATLFIFAALCALVLQLLRALAAFWGRRAKSNVLGLDIEAAPDVEKVEKMGIDSKKRQHGVAKHYHRHAAMAALKLNDRFREKPASPTSIPFLARSAQIPAACRQLEKLKGASEGAQKLSGLTSAEFERLRRIGAVYDASLPELHKKVSSYRSSEKNDRLQLEWGINLENGVMKVKSIQIMPDVDIMMCVAAHVEKELVPLYDKETLSCECLGERSDNDGVWRTIIHTKSTGSKSDLVNYLSVVDALDEPLGAIWVAYYVSTDFVPGARLEIPAPMDGHFRASKSLYVVRFEPLNAKTRMGVRMTSFLETGVSTAVNSLLSMMPSFALRRLVRGMVETAADSLVNFCRTNPKIDKLMESSTSVMLYQRLLRHLEGKPDWHAGHAGQT